jgi:hypothetical protein
MTAIDTKEVLKYRLLGSHQDMGMWGHEYIRLKTIWISYFCLNKFLLVYLDIYQQK